jgi:hypothetical protein
MPVGFSGRFVPQCVIIWCNDSLLPVSGNYRVTTLFPNLKEIVNENVRG